DVYVGESSTLSAQEQARLLGEAWERAEKPEALDVRLVIHHRSGRADTYHLGAHPPSLTSGDLDLIHRLWLHAPKTVGPPPPLTPTPAAGEAAPIPSVLIRRR